MLVWSAALSAELLAGRRVMAACAASGVFLCNATEEPFAAEKIGRRL
jgi:hypothetical protein